MKRSLFSFLFLVYIIGARSAATPTMPFESTVAMWPQQEQPFDRGFRLDDFFSQRLADGSLVKGLVSREDIRKAVAFLDSNEERRVAELLNDLKDLPNRDEIMSSIRAPQMIFHRQVEVFLKYFDIPGATVHRFDDLEFGISGWVVLFDGKRVRAFQIKSESLPQTNEKKA